MLDLVTYENGQVPMTRFGLHATESLLRRIRSEFLEMPGLSLTTSQAARLWNLDPQTSQIALHMLVDSGFLMQARNGQYIVADWLPMESSQAGLVG